MKKNTQKCERCGREFIPVNRNQRFCGSVTKFSGCSYLNHVEGKDRPRFITRLK